VGRKTAPHSYYFNASNNATKSVTDDS
jgi:hypothetical protein